MSDKPVGVVKKLAEPIYMMVRNITVDNWFTDIDLVFYKRIIICWDIKQTKAGKKYIWM